MNRFVISLLVFNQLEVTRKCVESVLKNTELKYTLVLVDNASRDDTAEYLQSVAKAHRHVHYVRNDENLGFIAAHNQIFDKYSAAEYFCVLNNDIIIDTFGWDRKLISTLNRGTLLAQVGPIQNNGYIGADGVGRDRPAGEPLDYIEGSCFIVLSKYVREAGGLFEDRYMRFAFCEDADLSLRLRAKGFGIAEVPIAVQHLHHQSFKNEKVEVDFKAIEVQNNAFLRDRWRKYFETRRFDRMKILIDREGALGDSFCTEPIARALKEKYPASEIYVHTLCPQWYQPCDYIQGCGEYRGKMNYDLVIDLNLAYERRPMKHVVEAYAEVAGVKLTDLVPRYLLSKPKPTCDLVVVNSEGSWASRTWDLEKWTKFVTFLKNQGKTVIEVGANPATYLGVGQDLVGKLTLRETIEYIAKAECYCGFDGGLMHFAQSVGTPVFIVFGCTCPNYRIHDWSTARVVWLDQDELECAGCHHWRDAPRCYTECDQEKTYCLDRLTPEFVIQQYLELPFGQPTKELR